MIRVLFVCLGNICRSPMAEAVFGHKVRTEGLQDRIQADSAGTGDWHRGEQAHRGTRRILEIHGIVSDHCARVLTRGDLETFDYIITMDESNLRNVRTLGMGRARVLPLMEFAPQVGVRDVPDPYYTGGFDEVYRLIDTASDGLLAAIRREHHL